MEVIVYILYSINNYFKINDYFKIKLIKKIGEGNYGYVYEINNDLVIKIFKNYSKIIENSDNDLKLIPKKTENREVQFFISYLKSNFIDNQYLIKINCIGIIKFNNFQNYDIINNYCLILPYCFPLIKLINQWKMPLITNKFGKMIILKFMKKLIEIELFMNSKFNTSNLDIKLNNYMIEKNKKIEMNNIIAIDFGLTIKKNKNYIFNLKNDYYIWPDGNNIDINDIPSYAICINGLILFLGLKTIKNISIEKNLKYIKSDFKFYNIFYHGLIKKVKINDLYELVNQYLITISN